jgi:hypothetical protein
MARAAGCAYEKHGVEFAQRRDVRLEVPSLLRPHHLRRAEQSGVALNLLGRA